MCRSSAGAEEIPCKPVVAIARDARATAVTPALAVSDLRKRYGRTEALRGVDLEVGEASCSACSAPTAPASRRW